jgi:DNA-3-methyladenine glycosylase II
VLLRGLGRLNIYPGDDVGARNNLRSWLKLRKPLDYEGVQRVTAKWQPYAGFVYFHLLLDRLDVAGHLAPKSAANQL